MLVGASVDVGAQQLFGCGIGHRFTGELRRRGSVGVTELPGYPEVGQEYSLFTVGWTGEQNISRFDVRCSMPRLWA